MNNEDREQDEKINNIISGLIALGYKPTDTVKISSLFAAALGKEPEDIPLSPPDV